jgi:predicted histidine transporter YuiF (NhaC family)
MIAAAGFCQSLLASNSIDAIVKWIAVHAFKRKIRASFSMLFIGFLIFTG